eukprot:60600-Pyramimonas_sp.AAC.1
MRRRRRRTEEEEKQIRGGILPRISLHRILIDGDAVQFAPPRKPAEDAIREKFQQEFDRLSALPVLRHGQPRRRECVKGWSTAQGH